MENSQEKQSQETDCQHPADALVDDMLGYMWIAGGRLHDNLQPVTVCTECGQVVEVPADAFADAEGTIIF